jgi:hypothetical protein
MRGSDARRAAVGAWVMATFQGAVCMQHYRSSVTHRLRIRIVENGHVVTSR